MRDLVREAFDDFLIDFLGPKEAELKKNLWYTLPGEAFRAGVKVSRVIDPPHCCDLVECPTHGMPPDWKGWPKD